MSGTIAQIRSWWARFNSNIPGRAVNPVRGIIQTTRSGSPVAVTTLRGHGSRQALVEHTQRYTYACGIVVRGSLANWLPHTTDFVKPKTGDTYMWQWIPENQPGQPGQRPPDFPPTPSEGLGDTVGKLVVAAIGLGGAYYLWREIMKQEHIDLPQEQH